jgi:hypothetical protein
MFEGFWFPYAFGGVAALQFPEDLAEILKELGLAVPQGFVAFPGLSFKGYRTPHQVSPVAGYTRRQRGAS